MTFSNQDPFIIEVTPCRSERVSSFAFACGGGGKPDPRSPFSSFACGGGGGGGGRHHANSDTDDSTI